MACAQAAVFGKLTFVSDHGRKDPESLLDSSKCQCIVFKSTYLNETKALHILPQF